MRALIALAIALSVFVPSSIAFASEASTYSWYGSTLEVGGYSSWTGATRYYDGSNVGIEMTCRSSGSGTFDVELHRGYIVFNDYIGTVAFNVNGFTKGTWTNVGSGNYYFKFNNPRVGLNVYSNDVAMYSW